MLWKELSEEEKEFFRPLYEKFCELNKGEYLQELLDNYVLFIKDENGKPDAIYYPYD